MNVLISFLFILGLLINLVHDYKQKGICKEFDFY